MPFPRVSSFGAVADVSFVVFASPRCYCCRSCLIPAWFSLYETTNIVTTCMSNISAPTMGCINRISRVSKALELTTLEKLVLVGTIQATSLVQSIDDGFLDLWPFNSHYLRQRFSQLRSQRQLRRQLKPVLQQFIRQLVRYQWMRTRFELHINIQASSDYE